MPRSLPYSCLLGLGLLSSAGPVLADNWVFSPRAEVGYLDYRLTTPVIEVNGRTAYPRTDSNLNLLVYGIGISASKNRFVFDAALRTTNDDQTTVPGVGENAEGEVFTGDRREFSLAVGYRVWDGLITDRDTVIVNVGYQNAETDLSGNRGSPASFKVDGYFLSLIYGVAVSEKGFFAAKVGFADLDGDLNFNSTQLLSASPIPQVTIDATSEARGVNYGVSYSHSLSPELRLSLSVDYYTYEFSDVVNRPTGALPDQVEEELLSARLLLSYTFH